MNRIRIDDALVEKSLCGSIAEAMAAIDERTVTVNGAIATTYAHLVAPEDELAIRVKPRYISRGGVKLESAIKEFGLDFKGKSVIDVGASTGGFTDCALQHGARTVLAVDVGKNLLHEKIAVDPRVTVVEKLNARDIGQLVRANDPHFADLFDIAVVDLSFISIREVLESILTALRNGSVLVLLIKPQFEASKAEADRGGGVISDSVVHQRVCDEVTRLVESAECRVEGVKPSPILGHDGNQEFLLVAKCARVEPPTQ
ncbi:MAG: TlyA family RNA methyltransferase [Actinomycetota bacterium]